MYCPFVAIFPSLCRSVPSNTFSVIGCKSAIDVEISKLIKIRECRFKGFLGYF